MRYSQSLLNSLKQDRLSGCTVPELVTKYSMPKTSVWHHIQNLKLPTEIQQNLRSSRGGSAARAQERWKIADSEAEKLLGDFKERQIWPVLLTALYWAEGTKSSFVFTNTDESMMRIFLRLVRVYLHIPDDRIDVLVRICKPMKPLVCRRHWSSVTGIPVRNVRVNFHDQYNKSTTKYGMCRITLKGGGDQLKLLHCLIRHLTDKMLP